MARNLAKTIHSGGVLALLLGNFGSLPVQAQPALGLDQFSLSASGLAVAREPLLKSGMHAAEVLRLLGDPDGRAENDQATHITWHYGRSLVFFDKNRVTAWLDAGELAARSQTSDASRPESDYPAISARNGWVSAWEHHRTANTKDVIEQLLTEPQGKSDHRVASEPLTTTPMPAED